MESVHLRYVCLLCKASIMCQVSMRAKCITLTPPIARAIITGWEEDDWWVAFVFLLILD